MIKKVLILAITCFLASVPGFIRADDTEIFGGSLITVPPNVLIIFDNSGSMAENITVTGTGEAWDKTKLYDGDYDPAYVYTFKNNTWSKFCFIGSNHVVDTGEIDCPAAQVALNNEGVWQGNTKSNAPYGCAIKHDSVARNLRTGNYINYDMIAGSHQEKKIDVAKRTINKLIDTTDGVRLGIMIFNNSEGGRIVAPCADRDTQADKDALKDIINGLEASTWTPLAETLAEAGLYFAGKKSWFNNDTSGNKINYATKYAPAIQWRCQKNYIIIMTDGEPTEDRNSILTAANYMNGKSIGDYDHDVPTGHSSEYYDLSGHAYASNGSDYLDDVAKFLYDNDILDSDALDASGEKTYNDSQYSKQNIITYTIGFAIDQNLLTRTADVNHGQGQYYTTASNISLSNVFSRIIGDILTKNSQFVSPVVPVNRINRTYADNGLYMGIFSPDNENKGLWKGNIKKFGFSRNGEILDRMGEVATDADGSIKEGAQSAWNPDEPTGTEGMEIDKGGAGTALKRQDARSFKTYKTGTGMITFNTTNTNITASDLGLTTAEQHDDLINFATAGGIYAPGSTDSKSRGWILGDIIHSQPSILYDRTNNKNVLFVGANDGFLHCFVDDDKGIDTSTQLNVLSDDAVTEAWAFIPWDLLPNLKYLPSEHATNYIVGDGIHDYFVDGTPVVFKSGGDNYVVFGLRRGGKNLTTGAELENQYFTLNVSTYTSPTFAFSIAKNILGNDSGNEKLGQSWATPVFCKIRTGSGTNDKEDVLFIAGGYDTNQDNTNPGTGDTKGRAVFAVNATDGTLNNHLNFSHENYSKMRYSMVDLRSYDDDDDGCDDVIYAPSVGGDLFVFESKRHLTGTLYDGAWSHRLLFSAHAASTDKLRKFLYAPGIAQETWGDFVYIGSGDREKPSDTTVINRFYAIRNTWPQTWNDDTPLTDSDLVDVTGDILQDSSKTETEKATHLSAIETGNGWRMDLEHSGEKIVSTPLVYNKVIYFTTFSPTTSSTSADTDLCFSTGVGEARLYAVDYKTGSAVFENFDGNSATLTKADKFVSLGSGIPSEPSIVVTEKGTFIITGTDTGMYKHDPKDKRSMTRYYWLKQ